jgi:hypothetical protein
MVLTMGRGSAESSAASVGIRSPVARRVRAARHRPSLHAVPDEGPVDVFGKSLERAARPDLELTLAEASDSNLLIPVYRDLVACCGEDRVYIAAGSHPEDPDIIAIHDYGRTTAFEAVLDRYLLQPVIDAPSPGLRNGNVLGLAAMLRHEHAHELWDRLDRDEPEFACAPVPRDAGTIGSALTVYAGDSFGDGFAPDDLTYFPSRRLVEPFCECFEIASHPAFESGQFPGWVGEMWARIRTLL